MSTMPIWRLVASSKSGSERKSVSRGLARRDAVNLNRYCEYKPGHSGPWAPPDPGPTSARHRSKGINSVRAPIPGGYLWHFSRYYTARDEVNGSKPKGAKDFGLQFAIGVLMFEHVLIDLRRRALLGAAGALIIHGVLLPTTASGQTTSAPKMKIGVIGAGHIGGTIGGLWTKAGHAVFFSSRHPEELQDLVARLGFLRRPAPSIRRLRLATLSSSPCLTARCRRSAEITANRWRERSARRE